MEEAGDSHYKKGISVPYVHEESYEYRYAHSLVDYVSPFILLSSLESELSPHIDISPCDRLLRSSTTMANIARHLPSLTLHSTWPRTTIACQLIDVPPSRTSSSRIRLLHDGSMRCLIGFLYCNGLILPMNFGFFPVLEHDGGFAT